jgi:hypothetical protein
MSRTEKEQADEPADNNECACCEGGTCSLGDGKGSRDKESNPPNQ